MTFRTLDSSAPDHGEVYCAALAMADFDGKFRDYDDALEWLTVAEQYGPLPEEYVVKRRAWLRHQPPDVFLVAALAVRTKLPPFAERARSLPRTVARAAAGHLAVVPASSSG